VERAPEGDDPGLAGRASGQLDGAVDCFGAAVAEEHLGIAQERRQAGDRLARPDVGPVLEDDRRVEQRVDLRVDRVHDVRVAVPGVGDGDARTEVEVAATIDVPHERPGGALRHHVEVARQHRGDRLVVAGEPRVGGRRGGGGYRAHRASSRLSICARWSRPE
jgi:hypothetical protein